MHSQQFHTEGGKKLFIAHTVSSSLLDNQAFDGLHDRLVLAKAVPEQHPQRPNIRMSREKEPATI